MKFDASSPSILARQVRDLLRKVPADAPTSADDEANADGVVVYEDDTGEVWAMVYVGAKRELDPCGTDHGADMDAPEPAECGAWWESFERALNMAGVYLNEGSADITDIFGEMFVREGEEKGDSDAQ